MQTKPKPAGSRETRRARARVAVIKALAHPSRLLIAEALRGGERCVADLTVLVGSDISTVSKHLSLLKAAGLVEAEKRGQAVYHRLCCPCFADFLSCVDKITRDRTCSTP